MDWKNKEWYDLIEKFAVAQSLMGVKKTLDVKARMFGEKPSINNITIKATATGSGQIARDMDRTAQEIQETYKQMMKALNKTSKIIKSIMRDLDNII